MAGHLFMRKEGFTAQTITHVAHKHIQMQQAFIPAAVFIKPNWKQMSKGSQDSECIIAVFGWYSTAPMYDVSYCTQRASFWLFAQRFPTTLITFLS